MNVDTSYHNSAADDDGPRPFGLLLLLVFLVSLIVGAGITYYVCCTKPDPIQKRNYPWEGKTTTTKKGTTKKDPKSKGHSTKKKTKKCKKEPKTMANLRDKKSTVPRSALSGKTKSKAPKSSAQGSGSSKSKSAGDANSSKANKGKDIKATVNSSTGDNSLMNGTTFDGNKVTMTPLMKNIFGQNVSQVRSLGSPSCTLSKESASSKVSKPAPTAYTVTNAKVTAKTKMADVTPRSQKEVCSKKKK